MSDAASKLAPTGRMRVAVYAVDLLRRTALSRVVVEAGHIVVGAQDAADVVLADGDCLPGEARPVVTLGGADYDLPGVLSRDAGASQIDAAIRAVSAGLIVRLPDGMDAGFGAMRETGGHALLTPRELEGLSKPAESMNNKAISPPLKNSLPPRKFRVESVFLKFGGRAQPE